MYCHYNDAITPAPHNFQAELSLLGAVKSELGQLHGNLTKCDVRLDNMQTQGRSSVTALRFLRKMTLSRVDALQSELARLIPSLPLTETHK